MKLTNYLLLPRLLLLCLHATAQAPAGTHTSTFAGLQGARVNPARAALPPFALDLNLASAHGQLGSDYLAIDLGDAREIAEGFDFDEDTEEFPSDDNNCFARAEISGSGLMFNLSPRVSVALATRARALFNLNRISGELYQQLSDDFENEEAGDITAEIRNLSDNVHTWREIGATCSHVVLDGKRSRLSVGANFKYLQGAGSLFFAAPEIDAEYAASSDLLTAEGNLTYGATVDFNTDEISADQLTTGLGLDLGIAYQGLHATTGRTKYRLGVSITDLSDIGYGDTRVDEFTLAGTRDVNNFNDGDFEESLRKEYKFTANTEKTRMSLLTALNALAEIKFTRGLSLTAVTTFSIGKPRDPGGIMSPLSPGWKGAAWHCTSRLAAGAG